MNRSHAVAIAVVKQASKSESAGRAIAKGLETIYHGGKKVVSAGADLGKGMAEHAGFNPEVGKIVGGTAAGYALYRGARGAKGLAQDKIDEFRIRHGLYPNVGY